ncbi:hypothetical protein SAY87_025330 [Trapa incisa]|uniref:Uncharacterized protein n=1 Tax=Trapa incisa TaxID=236973 RepID=A0AAN7JG40_9MYRT|nr:hypothetical protein SAY87_025330 [Trapa incisa]
MTFKYFTFIPNDPRFLKVRPGSPHPFFSVPSPASSSPDVLSNCISGFAAGVVSAHRRCLSSLILQNRALPRVEDEAVYEVGDSSSDLNYVGYPDNRRYSDVGSVLGKMGGMAADILDTLGSFTFMSGLTNKTHGIGILAFEIAHTIARGAHLMESLSEENIKHLKEVVLPSKGVQCLVSGSIDELLKIAALDKKEELKVFLGEVVRFGDLCKDSQWHKLDRYFAKSLSQKQKKQLETKENTLMQELMCLTHYTAELYYELHAIDMVQQDYLCKLNDYENSNASDKDNNSLLNLKAELKSQKKLIKGLKKKSLWSSILEEVVEKLVDIALFLCLKIEKVLNITDCDIATGNLPTQRTLGSECLDLQYAIVIAHINALVSWPNFLGPRTRDALYQGLPGHVQSALQQRLYKFRVSEDVAMSDIEEAMEERLQWLMPMAAKTIKAHHCFDWLGEWASSMAHADVMRIETLYHAHTGRTDQLILELLVCLHHLFAKSRAQNVGDGSSAQESDLSSPSTFLPKSEAAMFKEVMMQRLATSKRLKLGDTSDQVNKHLHRLATSSSTDIAISETESTFPREDLISPNREWARLLDIIDGVNI